jgi:hypothetical protein
VATCVLPTNFNYLIFSRTNFIGGADADRTRDLLNAIKDTRTA